jgi:hypothetical protein
LAGSDCFHWSPEFYGRVALALAWQALLKKKAIPSATVRSTFHSITNFPFLELRTIRP